MSDPLELELKTDVSCPVLSLGTKLASSVRVASDLNLSRLSSPSRFYPVCLSVCMSACLCMCRGVCVCRSEASVRYYTLETGPFFFFETVYVAWSLCGGLETPGILLPLHSQCVSGDVNSGTCVFTD